MTLEQIKTKMELMKAKVDLIVLEQEYAPYINQKEIKEMKKEIEEKLQEVENIEELYDYKVGFFGTDEEVKNFIDKWSEKGYIVDKFNTSAQNLDIIMKKRRTNDKTNN